MRVRHKSVSEEFVRAERTGDSWAEGTVHWALPCLVVHACDIPRNVSDWAQMGMIGARNTR